MTWEQFREVFYEKYFNDTVRGAKTEEFMGLIQGKLTFTEYVQAFGRLARFVTEMVPTDRARRDKFLRGLNSMMMRLAVERLEVNSSDDEGISYNTLLDHLPIPEDLFSGINSFNLASSVESIARDSLYNFDWDSLDACSVSYLFASSCL